MFARAARRMAVEVPDCLAKFGNSYQFHFLSHPGVMAVPYSGANFTLSTVQDGVVYHALRVSIRDTDYTYAQVSSLLELKDVVRMRANFTPENIENMKGTY